MADQKISELVQISIGDLADEDEFVIADASASDNKSITWGEMTQNSFKDATQGRVMLNGGHGIGREAGLFAPVYDFGDFSANPSGLYYFDSTGAPGPTGFGSLLAANYAATRQVRLAFSPSADRAWLGSIDDQNVEDDWREIYHTENIVGTVSQSGGTPTGAVIESGSNANGYWVRFADGTQICYQDFEVTDLPVTTAQGSAFRSANLAVPTFPASFSGPPVVTLRGGFATNVDGWITMNGSPAATNLTTGTLRALSLQSRTETFRWHYMAIGNWD